MKKDEKYQNKQGVEILGSKLCRIYKKIGEKNGGQKPLLRGGGKNKLPMIFQFFAAGERLVKIHKNTGIYQYILPQKVN